MLTGTDACWLSRLAPFLLGWVVWFLGRSVPLLGYEDEGGDLRSVRELGCPVVLDECVGSKSLLRLSGCRWHEESKRE